MIWLAITTLIAVGMIWALLYPFDQRQADKIIKRNTNQDGVVDLTANAKRSKNEN